MKLISTGHNHKETGEILRVSYRSINRWAKACEKEVQKGGLVKSQDGTRQSTVERSRNCS